MPILRLLFVLLLSLSTLACGARRLYPGQELPPSEISDVDITASEIRSIRLGEHTISHTGERVQLLPGEYPLTIESLVFRYRTCGPVKKNCHIETSYQRDRDGVVTSTSNEWKCTCLRSCEENVLLSRCQTTLSFRPNTRRELELHFVDKWKTEQGSGSELKVIEQGQTQGFSCEESPPHDRRYFEESVQPCRFME